MKIKIKDNRESLWQWDTGRVIILEKPCDVVHFANMQHGTAISVKVEGNEAKIPDELLQSGAPLYCYAFVGSVEDGYTDYSQQFVVEKKPKPTDYVFTPSQYITIEQLDKRIEALEKQGGGGGGEGFSPVVEITPIDNGHKVSITDVNGKKEFEVKNGKDGINGKDGYTPQKGIDYFDGEKGADGKTPVKGEDYFTETDINGIVTDVLNALPAWNGGAY
jgi:hypothetical protein